MKKQTFYEIEFKMFTPHDVTQDPILNVKEVAAWLEIHPNSVRALERKGKLPPYEFGLLHSDKGWRLSTLLNDELFKSYAPPQKKTEVDFLKGIIRELAMTLHALQAPHPARHKARSLFSKVSDLGLLHETKEQQGEGA